MFLNTVEGHFFVLQVTFDTNKEFRDMKKAGRDKCSLLTQPPLSFVQHQNKSSLLVSRVPESNLMT